MKEANKLKEYVYSRYIEKYEKEGFEKEWECYMEIPSFGINENIFEQEVLFSERTQLIVRLATQYYLHKAFEAMKVDMQDKNVSEEGGNIGTPGRIAKMWVGSHLADDRELLCGRWTKKPRLAMFPNENNLKVPVTKKVSLISMCSHHLVPFSSLFKNESYVLISYIPNKKVIGISKLQRIVNWLAQRGWLQEDLTKRIYEEVQKVTQTDSVYVELKNIIHSCEYFRGSLCKDGTLSTYHYGGLFNKKKYREMINDN